MVRVIESQRDHCRDRVRRPGCARLEPDPADRQASRQVQRDEPGHRESPVHGAGQSLDARGDCPSCPRDLCAAEEIPPVLAVCMDRGRDGVRLSKLEVGFNCEVLAFILLVRNKYYYIDTKNTERFVISFKFGKGYFTPLEEYESFDGYEWGGV